MSANPVAIRDRELARTSFGRFGRQDRPESPDLALRGLPSLQDFEPDQSFPYPQANDLDKVVAVADCIHQGADTADAIASALDVSPREGAYYATAAGYLRLVESDRTTGLTTFSLTGLGESIRVSSSDERSEIVADMVSRLPDAQLVAEGGDNELAKDLQLDGLGESTAARRVATIRSWVAATSNTDRFTGSVSAAVSACSSRIEVAAQIAREQRASLGPIAAAQRSYGVCQHCWMALPATGACGCR